MAAEGDSKTVEQEGVGSYCLGIPRFSCPNRPDTAEYLDWMRGWDDAERLDKQDNPHGT